MNDFSVSFDASIEGVHLLKVQANKGEQGFQFEVDVAGLNVTEIASTIANAFVQASEKLK